MIAMRLRDAVIGGVVGAGLTIIGVGVLVLLVFVGALLSL